MKTQTVERQRGTVTLLVPPRIVSSSCVVGKMEGDGPLSAYFDHVEPDVTCGQPSWELAESRMQKLAFDYALEQAKMQPDELDFIYAGDLLSQCTASTYGLRAESVPFFGVYGACSTMAETLALGAMAVGGGFASRVACVTGSHFCSAERQFRMPLEYGGQRAPTAQWTVTGAGCVVLGNGMHTSCGARNGQYAQHITHFTVGKIVDAGVTDANNMGAAMAPAAHDTITRHLRDLGVSPAHYDLILTGDLGSVGSDILLDLCARDGVDLRGLHNDCGMMIYDPDTQDVHAGGSGCGCSASVLCGRVLTGMARGEWKRVLLCATGALMSPITAAQGETIPGICCAVSIANA
ncbi:MAG: stage V sporulation protein AD [Oscillospiraceae bacterium]|nr:stage V sporulation protein AD [Oscillospiraceae bacterium]